MALLILNTYFLIYLVNFKLIVFNEDYYRKEFRKYGVYDKLDGYEIEQVNSDLLDYLRYERTNNLIDSDFFNEREKEHLLDVKALFQKALSIVNYVMVSFVLLVVLFFFVVRKELHARNDFGKWLLKHGSIILIIRCSLGSLTILGIVLLLKYRFSYIFTKFHEMFFKAGSWMFDTQVDKMVILYPEGFFVDVTLKIFLDTLSFSLILVALGFLGLYLLKRKSIKSRG